MNVSKKVIPLLAISLLLSACSNTGSSSESPKEVKGIEVEKKETKPANEEKKVSNSELGRLEVIAQQKGINDSHKTGPLNLTVKDIQISKVNPSKQYKNMFDGKDELSVVTVAVEVENTSGDTINFYPDQGKLVTDTKEQKEADILFSDDVGGEFIGQVKKSGNLIFLLDSKATDIHSIKIVIDAPTNSNFETIGDSLELNYSI